MKEGITAISWTVYGKIEAITKANGITIGYTYDAGGNCISKTVTRDAVATTTWYVRDAQGNVMSVYTVKSNVLTLSEQHLYGSSRLGIWNRNINMDESIGTPVNASGIGAVNTALFDRGNKVYELSNHLGNVLVTVSDKKRGVPLVSNSSLIDYYTADVTTAQDYYPFGMLMPGRRGAVGTNGTWTATGTGSGGSTLPANASYSNRTGNAPSEYKATQSIEFLPGFESGEGDAFEAFITTESSEGGSGNGVALDGSGYRYGFNGKELDKGIGTDNYDYGARIYDGRLGRFLSVDPLQSKYADLTTYHYTANNPINFIDLEGKDTIRFTYRTTIIPMKTGLGGYQYGGGAKTSLTETIIKSAGEDKFFYDAITTIYDAHGIAGIPLPVTKEFYPNSKGRNSTTTGITTTYLGLAGNVPDNDSRALAKIASSQLVDYLGKKDPPKYNGLKTARAFLALEEGVAEAHATITKILIFTQGVALVGKTLELTTIYRTISEAEAQSILNSGKFSFGPNGSEMKQFFTNEAAYNTYIKTAGGSFANGYKLEMQIPKSMIGNGKVVNTSIQVDEYLFPAKTINTATVQGQNSLNSLSTSVKNIKITKE